MTMISYLELYKEGVDTLKRAGIAEAEIDARLLIEFVTKKDRNALYAHGDDPISEEEINRFRDLIGKRSNRIPLQHLIGSTGFMGLDFAVNEHVLIPRWDSECLVEEALIHTMDGDKVLDMCTGSGCILISIMHYKNEIIGVGADISKEALTVAEINAKNILKDYETCPRFVQGDLFDALSEDDKNSFDIIVANPPYIRPDVIKTLEPEVRDHEPMMALNGGEDGLFFYRRITENAKDYLKKGGFLLYEIGYDQAGDVTDIMEKNGFMDVKVIKDLAGLDRVVSGYL